MKRQLAQLDSKNIFKTSLVTKPAESSFLQATRTNSFIGKTNNQVTN